MSFPFPISIGNQVYTGPGNDNVHISKAPGIAGALGLYDVNINGQHQLMTKAQLEATTFNLGSGNDTLVVDANVTADITANGGAGTDVMLGGAGDDNFNGGTGNDLLAGGGGFNEMKGGLGNDVFVNTSGFNHNEGQGGNDSFLNLGGINSNEGGRGWDSFANLGGFNFNQQQQWW